MKVKVYGYGGCTSCGNGLYGYLRDLAVEVETVNMQVASARSDALAMARESGIADPFFPMVVIGDTIICGFVKPEIKAAVDALRLAESN